MASVGGPGRMIDIDVIFRLVDNPAAAAWAHLRHDCTVSLFTSMQAEPSPAFSQIIAHELAHCFLWSNLRPQFGMEDAAEDWWDEGVSEYLSNLVYPRVDLEWGNELGAMSISRGVSLLDLSYATFLWWQFLESELGPRGIFGLLRSLPTSGGKDETIASLIAYGDMEVRFQEFVEEMTDGLITDTGSGRRNGGTDFPTIRVSQPFNAFFDIKPFAAAERRLEVDACKRAHLELDQGDAFHGARKPTLVGEWTLLPPTLPSGGDQGRLEDVRLLAITATSYQRVPFRVTAVDEDPRCDDDDGSGGGIELQCVCDSGYFFRDDR